MQVVRSSPWHETLPHFRADRPPSGHGDELQSEYMVPRESAVAAMRAVRALDGPTGRVRAVLLVSEIRSVAADELWLSMCHRRAAIALHFTWKHDEAAVRALLPLLEAALAPFAPRPHWGKLFVANPARHYPELPRYRALVERIDPNGKFRNAFVDALLGDPAAG